MMHDALPSDTIDKTLSPQGYEVSRSLAACEGCLLVVDAAQVSSNNIYNI